MKLVTIWQCNSTTLYALNFREGLRTLVISQKLLEEKYFKDWQKKYKQAKSDLVNRDNLMAECLNELEEDMELLGVTGVEGNHS